MTDHTAYLFVYGTLVKGDSHPDAQLGGFGKVTDGCPYPTIAPTDDPDAAVDGQIQAVENVSQHDHYEGTQFNDPDGSLYWRLPVDSYNDLTVWCYVGNPALGGWPVDYTLGEVAKALMEADLTVYCLPWLDDGGDS